MSEKEHVVAFGHGAGDPGGVGNGTNERDFNRKKLYPHLKKWSDLSKFKFRYYDVSGKVDLFAETNAGRGVYSLDPKTTLSLTEIHEDASSNASAHGGHVIISSLYNPDKADLALAELIKKYIGWWGSVANTKGVNKRNNLLNLNVSAQRGIAYRLLELGFITNKKDFDNLNKNLDAIAKGIIEGITGEKLSVPVATGNNRPRHSVITYWYGSKSSGALKGVEKFCKDNNWAYRLETAKDGRIMLICGTFSQKSSHKNKLTKYLEDKNLNYEVVVL